MSGAKYSGEFIFVCLVHMRALILV